MRHLDYTIDHAGHDHLERVTTLAQGLGLEYRIIQGRDSITMQLSGPAAVLDAAAVLCPPSSNAICGEVKLR